MIRFTKLTARITCAFVFCSLSLFADAAVKVLISGNKERHIAQMIRSARHTVVVYTHAEPSRKICAALLSRIKHHVAVTLIIGSKDNLLARSWPSEIARLIRVDHAERSDMADGSIVLCDDLGCILGPSSLSSKSLRRSDIWSTYASGLYTIQRLLHEASGRARKL